MARRVISSGKDVQETDQSGGRRSGRSISSEHAEGRSIEGYADRSKAEGFVDARRLQSEDLVSKTLQETTGTIGIMTRPKVVDFGERLKERRQAGARAIVLRVLIGLVVAVVLGAVVWLFLFSSVFRLEPGNISVVGANEWVSESQVLDIEAAVRKIVVPGFGWSRGEADQGDSGSHVSQVEETAAELA